MKIAIIHDWLIYIAGAENVLAQILKIFPNSDLFSVINHLSKEDKKVLYDKNTKNTFIQNFPFSKKLYQKYLPFMPFAIEQLDVSSYDLIISSSYAVAKGVITGPNQLHICYCHTPIRYAWDLQHQYLTESNLTKGIKSLVARYILFKIRNWDYRTANNVDFFIANSKFVKKRIHKIYRRDSDVIYPGIDISDFHFSPLKENYYLTASRLVPYKKIDLIVKSFNKLPNRQLVVIGDGPQLKKIKSIANSNIIILGYQPTEILRHHLQKAKAFIFAAEEDFGIIPIEAQACGTPVIAFKKGGTLETVIDEKTGIFFDDQTEESIINAVNNFERFFKYDPEIIRNHASKFSNYAFSNKFYAFVIEKYNDFIANK
ncbi:Glycosyltransferase involved in cell wall bisynthesis [Desulfomicrobium apsheronum]|uniref:Glycosyltransferase involved in cell wall bisynthesis n=1 Tax=Desulfomicrobium apsheronum TaxID=52560 RepID=A0A1I3WLJ2_9BACT|nr:glycosyltransferase family 4 protein [Desulfomicrobium apsheronum]SFK08210.1 Glycosyltransferase involved in cell wall bisynthesis [Desulfomicrobium apsheronum]